MQALALSFVIAAATAAAPRPAAPRPAAPRFVESRADVPWSVVVRATPAGVAAPACTDAAIAALVARGARCAVAGASGGTLVTLEGPPALAPALEAALVSAQRPGGALFAETHARASVAAGAPLGADAVAGPLRAPPAAGGTAAGGTAAGDTAAGDTAAGDTNALTLALAPGPTLFGLEGALLTAALEDALGIAPGAAPEAGASGEAAARVVLEPERARVRFVLGGAPEDAARAARAAVDKLAARPPPNVERLWLRARAVRAQRDAVVGTRATARARAWLATGRADIDSAEDTDAAALLARVRARVFSAALVAPAPSAPAPAVAPAPAAR